MSLADTFKSFSKQKKIALAAVLAAVIAVICLVIVFMRSGYLATTMRLLRVQGTVNIEDQSDQISRAK